ncbi:hypothetical protein [Streptomyces collinus]
MIRPARSPLIGLAFTDEWLARIAGLLTAPPLPSAVVGAHLFGRP